MNLLYNQLLFLLYLPLLVVKFRTKPQTPILIPIGASALPLYKIWMLGLFTRNPIWLYFVDDLSEISIRQNQFIDQTLCKLFYTFSLKQASRIFAISDNLANVLKRTSCKNVEVILPCFQKIDAIKKKELVKGDVQKYTFVFTGGLSFLYNKTLKIFSDFLNRMQNETNKSLCLIIQTYSSKDEFDRIGFSGNVEYRTSENRAELYGTYEEADAFIVPYSFDESHSQIISTSFPQKIAQIIQLGIPIVVFGPPYGSVVNFFDTQKLDYVMDKNNYELFKQTLLKLAQNHDKATLIKKYLDIYDQNFSQKSCLKRLI